MANLSYSERNEFANFEENDMDEEYNFISIDQLGSKDNVSEEEFNFEVNVEVQDKDINEYNSKIGDDDINEFNSSIIDIDIKECNYTIKEEHVEAVIKTEKKNIFLCDKCEFSTSYSSNLIKHKRIVHEKEQKLCTLCDKMFSSINVHNERVHKKLKKFKCDRCKYACYNKLTLKKHIENVHLNMNDKKTCETCFVKCIDMDKHIRKMHTNPEDIQEPDGDLVFTCDQCEHSTSYLSNLKKHKRNVHDEEQYLCTYCNKMFKHITAHNERVHQKLKNYKCDQCEYSCYKGAYLRRHKENVHEHIKPKTTCLQCFIRCTDLDYHIKKMHINPSPAEHYYPCTYCDFTSNNMSNVGAHIRTLHDIVLTKCKVCGEYINKQKTAAHMKKHTENQFKCDVCERTYREKRDLAKHILYFHREFRLKCKFCEKNVPNIVKHIKFMHKEENWSDVDFTKENLQFHEIKVLLGESRVYNSQFI